MKLHLLICAAMLSLGLLTACSQGRAPTLPGHTPNTGPLPAPDAYQRNSAINASTTIAPSMR